MQNKNVGFVLIKMTNTKLYDSILYTIKEFINHNPYNQYIIFNSFCDKIQTFNIPIMHIHQMEFFDGTAVLFDLPSIILTKKFPNLKQRIYYASEALWTKTTTTKYKEWSSIYLQNNLDILSSSQEINDLYSICWKPTIGIAERFDYETLSQYI